MRKLIGMLFLWASLFISTHAMANTLTLTSSATNNGNGNFTVSSCGNLSFSATFTFSVFPWRQETFTIYRNGASNLGSQMHNQWGVGNVTVTKNFTVPSAEGTYTVKRTGLGSSTSSPVTVVYASGLSCQSPMTTTSFGADMWFARSNNQSTPVVGDFDNDGFEDDITYFGKCGNSGARRWRAHEGNGSAFATTCYSGDMWFRNSNVLSTPMVGDFDGDGFNDDIVYYGTCGNGSGIACWRAHLGNGSTFTTTNLGGDMWFAEADARSKPFVGDFDNDGFKDDIGYYGKCGNSASTCWRVHIVN